MSIRTSAASPTDSRPVLRVRLPDPAGGTRLWQVNPARDQIEWAGRAPSSRRVFSAVHVCPDPLSTSPPDAPGAIDWQTTLSFRHHIWDLGLGVADAMDTAQRGGGLSWPQARELIRLSGREAQSRGAALLCGAATDQLPPGPVSSLDEIIAAYVQQVEWVVGCGGVPVLMASRQLAAAATGSDDYRTVYERVLADTDGPLVLHWLGEAFDPLLRGYWGSRDLDVAADVVVGLLTDHPGRFDGVKVSLLDAAREVALRRRLPAPVRTYTGDDFHYADLLEGDEHGASDALLGAFAAFADVARLALDRLDAGDIGGYHAVLDPTVPLARHLFSTPTSAYKTGVAFLAYLNGHQSHPLMLGGAQGARSVQHLSELFRLADRAGALLDPALAVDRLRRWLEVCGVHP